MSVLVIDNNDTLEIMTPGISCLTNDMSPTAMWCCKKKSN